jgi:hypothetical protein
MMMMMIMMRISAAVTTTDRIGDKKRGYKILIGKLEREGAGRPRHRRAYNTRMKMNLREVGWGCALDSSGSGYEQPSALL